MTRWVYIYVMAVATLVGAPVFSTHAEASRCTRLAMSDVAFGKEAAIASARTKLDQLAQNVARDKGWPRRGNLRRINEKIGWCRVYLDLGPLGTEYRCLVNVTYCAN